MDTQMWIFPIKTTGMMGGHHIIQIPPGDVTIHAFDF